MLRPNYLRIALVVGLGLVAAGLHRLGAEEKNQPVSQSLTAQARRDAAKAVYEGSWQRHLQEPESVPGDVGYFYNWSVRWLQAERDLAPTKANQIAALEGHLKRMQFWKELLVRSVKDGMSAPYEASAADFFRLEAEDWLAAAKSGGK